MSEHAFAHGLLANIHKTTPGGIRREQIARRSPYRGVMAALGWTLSAVLIALSVLTITR